MGSSKAHRQRHRARRHSAARSHLAHPRLRSLLLLRMGLGAASLRRQLPLPVGFHSLQAAVRLHSVSRVVQHQLPRRIHLLLLPRRLAEVLCLPLVLHLSLMGDKSRSSLVAVGDADLLRDLSFRRPFLLVINGLSQTVFTQNSSYLHLFHLCFQLRYLTSLPRPILMSSINWRAPSMVLIFTHLSPWVLNN